MADDIQTVVELLEALKDGEPITMAYDGEFYVITPIDIPAKTITVRRDHA